MKNKILFIIFIVLLVLLIGYTSKTNLNTNNTQSNSLAQQNLVTCHDGSTANDTTECKSVGDEKKAEQRAQDFAITFKNKEYTKFWDILTPDIKKQNSKDIFLVNMENDFGSVDSPYYIYDKVIVSEDKLTAYAYYTINSGSVQQKSDAVKMEWVDGNWYFNAFGVEGQAKSQADTTSSMPQTQQQQVDKPEIRIEYISCNYDSIGYLEVKGTIYNKDLNLGRTANNVKVYIDFYQRGQIVGSDFTYPDKVSIQAGERVNFNTFISDAPSRWDSCQGRLDWS